MKGYLRDLRKRLLATACCPVCVGTANDNFKMLSLHRCPGLHSLCCFGAQDQSDFLMDGRREGQ